MVICIHQSRIKQVGGFFQKHPISRGEGYKQRTVLRFMSDLVSLTGGPSLILDIGD